MSVKKPALQSSASFSTSYDTHWFDQFTKGSAFNFLELLDGDKEDRLQEKALFLENKKRNPEFRYPLIKRPLIFSHRKLLTRLFAEITTTEKNEIVRKLYTGRIQSELWQLDMLEATLQKKDVTFSRISKKLYGAPDKEIFFSLVKDLQTFYRECLPLPEVGPIAKELLLLCPEIPLGTKITPPPTPKEFSLVKKRLAPFFADLIILVPEENLSHLYTAKDVQRIFREALSIRELADWRVTISRTSKAAINVQNDQKQILIPETREMTGAVLRELLAHEIGCHVMRHVHGSKSGLLLLSSGLQKYERSEEGFATLAQQVLATHFDNYSGLERHLSIGLASGVDGKRRDFRDVFTFLYLHCLLEQSLKNPQLDEGVKKNQAETFAWNATTRTFRGTTTKTKGACFTKDIIYREGNIRAWNACKKDSLIVEDFFFGKLDPTEASHQKLILWLKRYPARPS